MNQAPPRLPIWLIASVAVNLLLIGAIGGRMLSPTPSPSATELSARAGLERTPRFGGAENRRAARERLRAAWHETADMRTDLQAARTALKAAITADPYSASDVDEAFKTMREAEGKLQEATHSYLSEALAKTPAGERAALAEVMLRDRTRHGRRNRMSRRGDRERPNRDPGRPQDGQPPDRAQP